MVKWAAAAPVNYTDPRKPAFRPSSPTTALVYAYALPPGSVMHELGGSSPSAELVKLAFWAPAGPRPITFGPGCILSPFLR
ncbi:hypothetical protein GCM10011378_00990 [Hymenobacter glacieicola]|uniref:Uncharacterized protein n=1 Tax=Hymenobacter glacieicola TaxID=1562124 RepID=A0ABQ1WF13_9BACT|nr:hypothetical protein GCM10011378_00990 [Hymenobacter glacieicola]